MLWYKRMIRVHGVPATIVEKCAEPRSYMVRTPNGSIVRRNRKVLQELNSTVSRKLCIENENEGSEIKNDVKTPVTRSQSESLPVNVSNDNGTADTSKRVTFKEPIVQAKPKEVISRKSDRVSRKPARYVEQC